VVADDDVLDVPPPVDERTDLPVDLGGKLRKGARELGADDPIGRDAAAVEVEEPLFLARLEAGGVSVELRFSSFALAMAMSLTYNSI
jgi:hypothetical protein